MAVTVTHPFVSAIPDGVDATLVRPSNWNATHSITGVLDVINGGTGTGTPSIIAGPGIFVSGTWPNQTVQALPKSHLDVWAIGAF